MSSNPRKKDSGSVRVELKYCEHCGGLWVREGGGGVYCERCREIVADLPVSKRRRRRETSRRVMLPQRESLAETLLDRLGIPKDPVVSDEYAKEDMVTIPANALEQDSEDEDEEEEESALVEGSAKA